MGGLDRVQGYDWVWRRETVPANRSASRDAWPRTSRRTRSRPRRHPYLLPGLVAARDVRHRADHGGGAQPDRPWDGAHGGARRAHEQAGGLTAGCNPAALPVPWRWRPSCPSTSGRVCHPGGEADQPSSSGGRRGRRRGGPVPVPIRGTPWADALALAGRDGSRRPSGLSTGIHSSPLSPGGFAPEVLRAAVSFMVCATIPSPRHWALPHVRRNRRTTARSSSGQSPGPRWGAARIPTDMLKPCSLLPRVREVCGRPGAGHGRDFNPDKSRWGIGQSAHRSGSCWFHLALLEPEHRFNPDAERPRQPERQQQRWHVLARLQGDDRLPGHADSLGQRQLSHLVVVVSQPSDAVGDRPFGSGFIGRPSSAILDQGGQGRDAHHQHHGDPDTRLHHHHRHRPSPAVDDGSDKQEATNASQNTE